jgi:general secretion pathway protein G
MGGIMLKSSIKRRFVTLIEMMIVMFLIALITGVIAFNYRGSLEEGKAFKTKVGIEKLETILNLEVAKNSDLESNIQDEWKKVIERAPLVHDPKALQIDGWGKDYRVVYNPETGGVEVSSGKYEEYKRAHTETMFKD